MLAKIMSLFLLGLIRVLTGSQARWHGCPPKAEQRIYFANHQSHADLVMIWAALPKELRSMTRAIAAKDYWTMTVRISQSRRVTGRIPALGKPTRVVAGSLPTARLWVGKRF